MSEQCSLGRKDDTEKVRMGLVPVLPVVEVAKVLTIGARKYGDRNWEAGMDWHRPYDALERHLKQWWNREGPDKDTGLSHLAHACCELMFLMEYEARGIGNDDRPTPKGNGVLTTKIRRDNGN